jgi:hypothetical protein
MGKQAVIQVTPRSDNGARNNAQDELIPAFLVAGTSRARGRMSQEGALQISRGK